VQSSLVLSPTEVAVIRAALCLLLLFGPNMWSQTAEVTARSEPGVSDTAAAKLTLDQAILLAKKNAPQFRAALTEAGLAREDRVQARAALLPGVSYTTGAIYTQANGTPTGVFIAANAVNEYISQGVAHEALSFTSVADFRRARFMESLSRARAEIAVRGITTTVVRDFYGVIAGERKYQNAQLAADEGRRFLGLSQQLEQGGEVAHSDVIKAQLQSNDRERDLQEARLAAEKARLDLAVLIFPNFTRDYQLVDDLQQSPPLPEFAHVQVLAATNNPELKAASAAMHASQQEVASAIGGHLPSLSFNYFYGIDATQYATRSDGIHNLGYQVAATVDIPIFNWGATQSKVRQAQFRRDQARIELSAAQRQALADLQQFYNEAQTAQAQLELLHQSSDLAAEGLRLTTLRYQSGEATALEVVDAQNALVLARNNQDDGSVRYRVALANLQTLTGTF
jgi:outer membrane protein TolC